MGDDRYYGDAPRFKRRDPLRAWAIFFFLASAAALVWVFLLFYLMSTAALDAPRDTALGLSQAAWVIIALLALLGCVLGLIFVVVARVNRTRSEAYLDATGEAAGPPLAQVTRTVSPGTPARAQPEPTPAAAEAAVVQATLMRAAARIETTMGPDGRMLLSYTIPSEQPRGLYADTYVPVDADAVLNVKTLLAKTPGAR